MPWYIIVYHKYINKPIVTSIIKTKYYGNNMIYHDKCELHKYGIQVNHNIISAGWVAMIKSWYIIIYIFLLCYTNILVLLECRQNPDKVRSNLKTMVFFALPILKQLHWLPVKYRIDFKIAVLTYKLRTTSEPMYLSNLISMYEPRRFLRSADAQLLQTPRVKTVIGSRAFRSASPMIWNALPCDLRSSQSLLTFRHKLKTFYFKLAFNRTD